MKKEYSPLGCENKTLQKWENYSFHRKGDKSKYILEMFPYPSGHLHMGHVRNYSIGDVQARFYRMNGYNVIYPMGFDSFGLPAENAAIKHNINPLEWTEKNIANMKQQLKRLGLSYDWSTEISTSRASYYKWNQWLFIQFYKAGLIYRKKGYVNWDPVDKTVLANEQVIDGKGWRSNAPIEKKQITQWYVKITKYAEELLLELDALPNWPERVKNMQRQWIGKRTGTIITFDICAENSRISTLDVFTTRPDTLMGVTALAIAPEHDAMDTLLKNSPNAEKCQTYIQDSLKKDPSYRTNDTRKKTGVPTGLTAVHPITNEHLPLFIADYVLTDFGTGAVMSVPAHDDRDYAFAKNYHLPIIKVIENKTVNDAIDKHAYTGNGTLINSGLFDGLPNEIAKEKIVAHLTQIGKGKNENQYRLRDWLISRQRYWGTPIPIVYDSNGTPHIVSEADLPIPLPTDITFEKTGNPISSSPTFKSVHLNNEPFERETDTMDTYFDSSWYFFRYLNSTNESAPFEKTSANTHLPVDFYIGGIEHACLHLLYARFFTKALRDLGLHDVGEPFKQLICQGMVLKDGAKMSKSLGNTVDPSEIIDTYGADTARLFILFAAPVDKDLDWSDEGIEGAFRFLKRFYNFTVNFECYPITQPNELRLQKQCHKAIKKITNDIKNFQFNTAISQLMTLTNTISAIGTTKETSEIMAKLIAPFAPFIAERIWNDLGHSGSIHMEDWPTHDESLIIDDECTIAIQVNGKVRDTLHVTRETPKNDVISLALEKENIKKYTLEKEIIKTIVIPDRLINFVVK
jgi:leucyl-tRNA synthetase